MVLVLVVILGFKCANPFLFDSLEEPHKFAYFLVTAQILDGLARVKLKNLSQFRQPVSINFLELEQGLSFLFPWHGLFLQNTWTTDDLFLRVERYLAELIYKVQNVVLLVLLDFNLWVHILWRFLLLILYSGKVILNL